MVIKFLGTGAYDGVPSMFCKCQVCKDSLKLGGKNIRSRTQALINNDLLIDFPPDSLAHYHKFNFNWQEIKNCLITHTHSDHFYVDDMSMASKRCGEDLFHFFGGEDCVKKINCQIQKDKLSTSIDVNLLTAGKKYNIGNYVILPLKANHDNMASSLVYVISDQEKSILYANDTGIFSDTEFEALKSFGKLDAVSLDCTGGLRSGWLDGHLCLETAR